MPKRPVGNAFCNFASITVLASFPNSVDYNREENNRYSRDADRPHARLPPKIRRRRLKLSEAQARERAIGRLSASRENPGTRYFFTS